MDIIWLSGIIGAALGAVLSVVFGIYSKSTADSYIRSLFGVKSTDLIMTAILLVGVAGVVFLSTISGLVRDLSYPTSKPLNFTIETLLMAGLPAIAFLIMAPLRGYSVGKGELLEFSGFLLKFGLLHILFQFSGVYSTFFPPK
jgi:hypothetical protein